MPPSNTVQQDLSLRLQTRRCRQQLAAAEEKLQEYEDLISTLYHNVCGSCKDEFQRTAGTRPASSLASPRIEAAAMPLSQDSHSHQPVAIPAEVASAVNSSKARHKSTARPRSRQTPRIVDRPASPKPPSKVPSPLTRSSTSKGKERVEVPASTIAVGRSPSAVTLHYKSLIQSDSPELGAAAFKKVTQFATETNVPRAMCITCISSRFPECHFQGWGKGCVECVRGHRTRCSFRLSPKERAETREAMAYATRENRRTLFALLMDFERTYCLYLSHVALTSQMHAEVRTATASIYHLVCNLLGVNRTELNTVLDNEVSTAVMEMVTAIGGRDYSKNLAVTEYLATEFSKEVLAQHFSDAFGIKIDVGNKLTVPPTPPTGSSQVAGSSTGPVALPLTINTPEASPSIPLKRRKKNPPHVVVQLPVSTRIDINNPFDGPKSKARSMGRK